MKPLGAGTAVRSALSACFGLKRATRAHIAQFSGHDKASCFTIYVLITADLLIAFLFHSTHPTEKLKPEIQRIKCHANNFCHLLFNERNFKLTLKSISCLRYMRSHQCTLIDSSLNTAANIRAWNITQKLSIDFRKERSLTRMGLGLIDWFY